MRANLGVGHDSNPIRKLYFKVLPKGTADVPGVLLGYPTLDTAPHGLGWEPKEGTHFFRSLGLHLPRAELRKRTAHVSACAEWTKARRSKTGKPPGYLNVDQEYV